MFLSGLMFIVHLVVCVALILIILLQTTKGSGMGAAFGGASQTLFGSTGRATFLTKVTIVAAVVFVFTSIGLSFVWTEKVGVVDENTTVPGPAGMPSLPPGTGGTPGAGANVPGTAPPSDATPPPGDGLPDLGPGTETPAPETPAAPPTDTSAPAPAPDSAPSGP